MSTFIATAIKMKNGCAYSNSLLEIDQIYLLRLKIFLTWFIILDNKFCIENFISFPAK